MYDQSPFAPFPRRAREAEGGVYDPKMRIAASQPESVKFFSAEKTGISFEDMRFESV